MAAPWDVCSFSRGQDYSALVGKEIQVQALCLVPFLKWLLYPFCPECWQPPLIALGSQAFPVSRGTHPLLSVEPSMTSYSFLAPEGICSSL